LQSDQRIMVLGLGNDLLTDDAVGILAVEMLRPQVDGRVHVATSSMHGLALLDLFLGYDCAILVDAIQTGRYPAGTILELSDSDLAPVGAPSPHYAGLPEMLRLAEHLELDFPNRLTIFAIEAADVHTIGGPMTEEVRDAIHDVCRRVLNKLQSWLPSPPGCLPSMPSGR
jgi:hydrogenase maturation protease